MRNIFKIPYLHLFVFVFCFKAAGAQAVQRDTSYPVANGAALQKLPYTFGFTEGPAVNSKGEIFFTDHVNDNIWKYDTLGTLQLFLHGSGRANGLYIDAHENIIACTDARNQLWKIGQNRKKTVLYRAPKKRRLNGPNDLWVDANGGIFFTDPYYQRAYWKRKKPAIAGEFTYYLAPGKKELQLADSTAKKPNGIVGTPDGKHLFIADIGGGAVYRFQIDARGMLSQKQKFIAQGSDGVTLDADGNIYTTGNGVTVYDSAGKKIAHIDVPAQWTSNVCFGGADFKTLFITASEHVYTIRMQVAGVEQRK